MGIYKSNLPDLRLAISYCALKTIGPLRHMNPDHAKKIFYVLIAILRAPCGQREYAIFSKDTWTTEKIFIEILFENEFFKRYRCDLEGMFNIHEVKGHWFQYLNERKLVFNPRRVDNISRETAWAKLGAKRKAAQDAKEQEIEDKSRKAAKEKAAKDKAAKDKAAKDKATKDKAAKEKATKDKAAKEKATKDNAAEDKAAKDKAAKDKAAKEKQEALKVKNEAANKSKKESTKKKTIQSAKKQEAVEAENSTVLSLGATMEAMLKKSTEVLANTLKQNICVFENKTTAQISKVLQSTQATEKEIKGLSMSQKNLSSTVTDLNKRVADLEDKLNKQEVESTIQAQKKKPDKKHKKLDSDTDTESDSTSDDEYMYLPLPSTTPPAYRSPWAASLPPQSLVTSFPNMMYPQSPISHRSHHDPTASYVRIRQPIRKSKKRKSHH